MGRWGRELPARVVPGQCQSEPHPATTPGPAAPVNKARISRALVALLVGFAWEFLLGLRRATEASSGRADSKHRYLSSGENAQFPVASAQRARGAAGSAVSDTFPGAPRSQDRAVEGRRAALGGRQGKGRDRAPAQQMSENYDVLG